MSSVLDRGQRERLRRVLIATSTTMIGLLTVIAILAMFAIWSMNKSWQRGSAEINEVRELRATALSTQIDFKIQIQEWKNLLLRGSDPASLVQYRAAFEARAIAVSAALQMFSAAVTRLHYPELKARGDAIRTDYDKLCAHYRAVLDGTLQQRASLAIEDALRIDRAVRGEDRSIQIELDALSTLTDDIGGEKERAIPTRLQERYHTLRLMLFAAAGLALALIAFNLYFGVSVLRESSP